jgi:hypothetical protein
MIYNLRIQITNLKYVVFYFTQKDKIIDLGFVTSAPLNLVGFFVCSPQYNVLKIEILLACSIHIAYINILFSEFFESLKYHF